MIREYRFLKNGVGTQTNPKPNGSEANNARVNNTVPGGNPVTLANGLTIAACQPGMEAYKASDIA